MPSSARQRSSTPVLLGGYVLVGFAIRLAQALYARSLTASPLADPISVMVGHGSFPEKVALFVSWWLIPALTWPFGLMQFFFLAHTKH